MTCQSLDLTAGQVAEALDICETAARRRVQAAEALLADVILPHIPPTICRSREARRARQAAAARLRIIAAIIVRHPEALEPWLERLQQQVPQASRLCQVTQAGRLCHLRRSAHDARLRAVPRTGRPRGAVPGRRRRRAAERCDPAVLRPDPARPGR